MHVLQWEILLPRDDWTNTIVSSKDGASAKDSIVWVLTKWFIHANWRKSDTFFPYLILKEQNNDKHSLLYFILIEEFGKRPEILK